MARKGYTLEQIIGKLREVEVLVHQGHAIREAARSDLLLMSSDNVRPIGLRKCPIRRTLPPQILVSQLCH